MKRFFIINNSVDSQAIKSGTWYTISSFFIRASSILTIPFFTRLLTVEDFGIVSNFFSWFAVVSVITGLGIAYSIGIAKTDFQREFNQYLSSIQILANLSATTAFFIIYIFINSAVELFNLQEILVIILFLYLITYPSIIFIQEKNKFNFKYKQNLLCYF